VKNNPPAGVMNKRGDRDGKFRAIVNPDDIAGSDTFDHAPEDRTNHPAMKEPGQVLKVLSKALVEHHGGQNVDRLRGEAPGSICAWTDDYGVRRVAEYVSGPAGDCASGILRKCLGFGKKMISSSGHSNSE
jgi:hypothetical protein